MRPLTDLPHGEVYTHDDVEFRTEFTAIVQRCQTTQLDITLAFDVIGDPRDPVVVAIGGLMTTLTFYDDVFCATLAKAGYCVVRFDNRDAGKSTVLSGLGIGPVVSLLVLPRFLQWNGVPYTLRDMARDVIGLLDVLQVPKAHVLGQSMGGMVAQFLLRHHAERLSSVTLLMSSTSAPNLPWIPRSTFHFMVTMPKPKTYEARVQTTIRSTAFFSPPGKYCEDRVRWKINYAIQRDRFDVPRDMRGMMTRQYAAILESGDRTGVLAAAEQSPLSNDLVPVLVLHGEKDNLFLPEHGAAAAAALGPSATFCLLPEMGHIICDGDSTAIVDKMQRFALRPCGGQSEDL